MNTFSTRTRRGAAILFSGVLVFGGLALTSEATAGQEVDGNPTCTGLGYEYGEKWDNEPPAGTYTLNRDGMEASLTVGTYTDKTGPNANNAITAYSISTNADGYAIVVKGGPGATVYRSGPGGLESPPLHAPAVGRHQKWPTISHFQLCWNGPPEPGEIEVTKVVLGTDTPGDYTFEICVTPVDTDGDPLCKKVVGNATLTFENLPPGEYVVTETDPGPRFSVEGSGVTVTVKTEDTTEATVTNTWIPPKFGRVEVTKAVTGDGAPTDGKYEICLTGPDPSTTKECKTVTGAGTVTFEDLVPGIYKVTETNPGTEYEVKIVPATVEVTIGKAATATVTNEYAKQESLPPTVPVTPEVLPPTVPVTPEVLPPTVPATPLAPVAPAAPTDVPAQTALPITGSEVGIAALATILVTAGVALTLLGRRREPQQA